MKLAGKVAIITGAGSGIGAAVAKRFVAEGAKVCMVGRRLEKLQDVAAKIKSYQVIICQGDVTKEKHIDRIVERTLTWGGKIDVLVNNAGITSSKPLVDLLWTEWKNVLDTNLSGPFLLMRKVIPHMMRQGGGSIINVASIAGLRCLPNAPAYCASKAGLIMLTKQVALDYGKFGIRCNCICPGGVITDMTRREFGRIANDLGMEWDEITRIFSAVVPLRRFVEAEEIADVFVFLASEESSYITGATIVVDGGATEVDTIGAISGYLYCVKSWR